MSRRRWASLLLIVGVVLVAAPLVAKAPHEREVHLDVQGPIERIELVWFDDDEAVRQTVLHFDRDAVPQRVTTRVSVPNGQYRLELRVTRGDRVDESVRRIDFSRGVEEVTVPVR